MVLGDPDELRVAISNLIDNAIKYSDGKIEVSVEVASVEEKRVAVRVTDRGIGVPHGELKRIFKRFYRAPRRVATRVKGAGLGLFIVRSIVRQTRRQDFRRERGRGNGQRLHNRAAARRKRYEDRRRPESHGERALTWREAANAPERRAGETYK